MTVTLDGLVECVGGPQLADGLGGASTWTAPTLGLAGDNVFGGQLLAQAVTIAARLEPAMSVKSVSAVFPRPVRDRIDAHHRPCAARGGSYATHRIEVAQPDREGRDALAFSASVIAHQPGEGLTHDAQMPQSAGSPDEARSVDLGLVPWACRLVGDTDLDDRRSQSGDVLLWTRVDGRLDDDGPMHQALLAYLTDLTLIGTALLPHDGWSQLDAHRSLRTSVIAHQVWFHRPLRIDDWLLVSQSSPAAAGGSSFGIGHVHDRDGRLVASFAQEAMIRPPSGPAAAPTEEVRR